jgi:hypothetical protein
MFDNSSNHHNALVYTEIPPFKAGEANTIDFMGNG